MWILCERSVVLGDKTLHLEKIYNWSTLDSRSFQTIKLQTDLDSCWTKKKREKRSIFWRGESWPYTLPVRTLEEFLHCKILLHRFVHGQTQVNEESHKRNEGRHLVEWPGIVPRSRYEDKHKPFSSIVRTTSAMFPASAAARSPVITRGSFPRTAKLKIKN